MVWERNPEILTHGHTPATHLSTACYSFADPPSHNSCDRRKVAISLPTASLLSGSMCKWCPPGSSFLSQHAPQQCTISARTTPHRSPVNDSVPGTIQGATVPGWVAQRRKSAHLVSVPAGNAVMSVCTFVSSSGQPLSPVSSRDGHVMRFDTATSWSSDRYDALLACSMMSCVQYTPPSASSRVPRSGHHVHRQHWSKALRRKRRWLPRAPCRPPYSTSHSRLWIPRFTRM